MPRLRQQEAAAALQPIYRAHNKEELTPCPRFRGGSCGIDPLRSNSAGSLFSAVRSYPPLLGPRTILLTVHGGKPSTSGIVKAAMDQAAGAMAPLPLH